MSNPRDKNSKKSSSDDGKRSNKRNSGSRGADKGGAHGGRDSKSRGDKPMRGKPAGDSASRGSRDIDSERSKNSDSRRDRNRTGERSRDGERSSKDGERRRDSRPSGRGERSAPRGKFGSYGKSRSRNEQVVKPDDGHIRLNKYLSNSGICSRRDADDLIKAGLVEVDGKIVTEMGFKVPPGSQVKYAGARITPEKPVYVLLNKPKDFITTKSDPADRRTVMNLLKGTGKERIYPVGRLDRATTGVLLFTNDGDLAKKLTHPKHDVKKLYHVHLDKAVKKEHIDAMLAGVELEDGPMKVDEISYVGTEKDKKQIGVQIHSGRNRIVRRLFEHFNYKVLKLDRVTFAGLTKKDLPRSKWRHLRPEEVASLKMLK